jgi:predicted nucleotidyltransferase
MRDATRDRLRAAVASALGGTPEVAAVYAYGSRVSGRPSPLSDLDLALVLTDTASPDDPLFTEVIANRIAEALPGEPELDVHLAEDLPLPVRGRVVTRGVLVFESDPARRVAFETATRRLYFDFLPLLERDARTALRAGG